MNQKSEIEVGRRNRIHMLVHGAAMLSLPMSLVLIPACGLPKRERSASTATAMAEIDGVGSDVDKLVAYEAEPQTPADESKVNLNGIAANADKPPTNPQMPKVRQTFPDTASLVPASMELPGNQPASVANTSQAAAPVKLKVAGVDPNRGPIRVAVFTAENNFPDHQTAAKKAVLPSVSETVEEEIQEMPSGAVAIAAFQDLNNDGILNRSSFGIPSEPYGFSNNARGQMGPPSFAQARVQTGPNSAVIPISLTKLKF